MPQITCLLVPVLLSFILLTRSVIADLRSDLAAANISNVFPGDSGYAKASEPFNLRFDYHPAAITFPSSPQEVSAVVKLGSDHNLNIVPRGGGHSYIANGLGGKNGTLIVDINRFNNIQINPSSNTTIIGAGNRLGDIVQILNQKGRALPHGTCPYVGIAGHTALGGFGFTSRFWGLALDAVIAIDAVLADGKIVKATESIHPDLFWAMRGAAPSFAIITSFEFKTFPVPPHAVVFSYIWQLTYQQASLALLDFQSYALSKPNGPPTHLGGEILLKRGMTRGSVYFELTGAWYGPASDNDGNDAINSTLSAFLSRLPEPVQQSRSGNGSYIDSACVLGGHADLSTSGALESHNTFYAKSIMIPEDQPLLEQASVEFMRRLGSEGFDSEADWYVQIELWGGAESKINSIPIESTAFLRRNTLFTMQLYASSFDTNPPFPKGGFKLLDGLVDTLTSNMPKNWDYGAYTDYIDRRLDNWRTLYYGKNYKRLETIKRQVDPKNIFKFPTSIEL
ncbi:glucooligosaccharide oxidase [Dendrothele bispora CBS 962.96]|uniref:Glucooligosaccharide oxidase n=1 Tax=Dendrothele bispora (strain CBS 962.96) TaxID=1314807 RepID=A0A4S8LBW6_DENBC|nr:glucooligosaccharide oxidase [Dendrothele bispora CBS 962.96]